MRFKQFLKESLADRHALNQENKKTDSRGAAAADAARD